MSITMPRLRTIRTRQEGVTAFAGLNHNLRIKDNEFFDMRNISTELLPVISARGKRRKLRTLANPNGLFAHEELCWVDGTGFFYGGERKGDVSDSQKQFVRMGAYVLIWPDKVYYNTTTDEFGTLAASFTTSGTVTCTLCKLDGSPYEEHHTGDTAPEDKQNGTLWMDTSQSPAVLRQWLDTTGEWAPIPTVYTKIAADGIGENFAQHDGVTISGINSDELSGNHYLVEAGADYITVVGLIPAPIEQAEPVTIERMIPDMDYLVEHDNRIWGCSSEKHEIYACSLGDPKNWNQYLGLASDSYAVTVGTTGDFTGAASHLGYVMFFKADCIHQMLGTKPANYQLSTTNCRGVAHGSEGSLRRVNETLFFMSNDEVCAYTSSLPMGISKPLGKRRLTRGIAGVKGSVYYISLMNEEGGRELYAYDTHQNVWVREDDADVTAFAELGGELYMLDTSGTLWAMGGSETYASEETMLESDVEWMLETGDIGKDRQAAQFVSAIQLHAQTEAKCPLYVEIQYDGHGEWDQVYEQTPTERRSMVIPIIPKRAKFIRLRIRGRGSFQLHSLTMRIETGSDQYGYARY